MGLQGTQRGGRRSEVARDTGLGHPRVALTLNTMICPTENLTRAALPPSHHLHRCL